jgi:hypothetical protein
MHAELFNERPFAGLDAGHGFHGGSHAIAHCLVYTMFDQHCAEFR